MWSPKIAAMAGAAIPLTPAVHQMISVGPIPQLAEREGEISFPIIRDMDSLCYERQHGADMEVGSYAHRAILHDPEEIPSIERAKLSPTEMPFTADDFDPQLETALELMPDALGADGAEIRYAINGLLSLTPDGAPVLGETPEVSGLWSAAAVWIKEGPGVGRALAEWMTHGFPEIDLHHSDVARFHAHQRTREHVRARTSESFIKTYGIVHPGEQWESDRRKRLAPMHAQQVEQGAQFFEAVGWERPQWYASNESLLGDYGDAVMPREHEWDSRWWSPIINAEHLAMRERAGIVDLSAFAVFDVVGPQALDVVQRTVVAQVDVEPGRVVYTPVLDARGGFRSDLTVMRLAHDRFRVVTGGAHGMADLKWFARPRPRPRGRRGRPDLGVHHDRAVGAARPRHPGRADRGRHQPRGLPLRPVPRASRRHPRRARLPDLLRRRARAGSSTSRWSRARRSGGCSTRPAAGTARCPSGSASTPRPDGWRRATARSASSSTASAASSRPACSDPR